MPRTTRSEIQAIAVGRAIRDARVESSLTQAMLAERLRTTQSYISRLEAGKHNLTLGQLAAIADALGSALDISFPIPDRETTVVGSSTGDTKDSNGAPIRANPR